MLAEGFSQMAFLILRYGPSVPTWLRFLSSMDVELQLTEIHPKDKIKKKKKEKWMDGQIVMN